MYENTLDSFINHMVQSPPIKEKVSKDAKVLIILEKEMKLTSKLALLTSASVFLATAALADTYPSDSVSGVRIVPKNSAYVAADLGYGALSTPDHDIYEPEWYITSSSHSTGNIAGGISAGVNHTLKPNLLVGAELGYESNGKSRYDENFINSNYDYTMKIFSSDWHLLATGTYLLPKGFDVFAKAGLADVKQKLEQTDDGTDTITQVKPMIATGVGYQVKMVNIYLQYAHIFADDANNFSDLYKSDGTYGNIVSTDTFKAGVAYNFAL